MSLDCEYIARDDGIHEFVLHAATRAAIDIELEKVLEILMATPPSEAIYIMADMLESGIPPLRYAMAKAKEIMQEYFNNFDGQQHPTYLAYVVASSSLLHTFKFFIEQLARGMVRIRFFDNREDAEAWLFSQMKETQAS